MNIAKGKAGLAKGAVLYWLGIFAAGFVLGTVRVLWLAPRLGDLAAVACELPVMLSASWVWAGRIVPRSRLPGRGAALMLGLAALVLLVSSELALALALFGQTPGSWLAALAAPAGLLGLAGQIGFGIIPALVWRRDDAVQLTSEASIAMRIASEV